MKHCLYCGREVGPQEGFCGDDPSCAEKFQEQLWLPEPAQAPARMRPRVVLLKVIQSDEEVAEDLSILEEAALDPEAVRKLLPPEKQVPPAEPIPGPAKPSMNMPRVVREKNEAAAESKPSELDALLAKGAITPEQYENLKKHFRKPQ